MASSSGSNQLVKLAVGWGLTAVIGVAVMAHREELRAYLASNGLAVGATAAEPRETGDARAAVTAPRVSGGVQIRANPSGHFETRAEVNGRSIDVMVDTGATVVALTFEDARAAGIHVGAGDFKHRVSTANGVARVASVMLERVSIEDIIVRDVRAVVAEPGKLNVTLLGMSFLSRLSKAEMSRGVLQLQE